MSRNGDVMVKIELATKEKFDMSELPDKAIGGRLQSMLRNVGASDSLMIRSRMITAVASTKYQTKDKQPISLIGVHGKDEILVVGPTWVYEEYANGVTFNAFDELRKADACISDFKELLTLWRLIEVDLFLSVKEVEHSKERLRNNANSFLDGIDSIKKKMQSPLWIIDARSWPEHAITRKTEPTVQSWIDHADTLKQAPLLTQVWESAIKDFENYATSVRNTPLREWRVHTQSWATSKKKVHDLIHSIQQRIENASTTK